MDLAPRLGADPRVGDTSRPVQFPLALSFYSDEIRGIDVGARDKSKRLDDISLRIVVAPHTPLPRTRGVCTVHDLRVSPNPHAEPPTIVGRRIASRSKSNFPIFRHERIHRPAGWFIYFPRDEARRSSAGRTRSQKWKWNEKYPRHVRARTSSTLHINRVRGRRTQRKWLLQQYATCKRSSEPARNRNVWLTLLFFGVIRGPGRRTTPGGTRSTFHAN